jgi:hypothetical protein
MDTINFISWLMIHVMIAIRTYVIYLVIHALKNISINLNNIIEFGFAH